MKALVIMDKPNKVYTELLSRLAIESDLEYIHSVDHPHIPVGELLKQAPYIIIMSARYKQVQKLIAMSIYSKANNPNLTIQLFITDLTECKRTHAFITVDTFEDIVCFNDSYQEYQVNRQLEELNYKTRQLLQFDPTISKLWKNCNRNTDKLNALLDAELTDLAMYDIELTTQLVPYLKMNVWKPDDDYVKKYGQSKDQYVVHVEERFSYKYEVTLYDRLLAYLSLTFYKQLGQPMLQRAYTNGVDYIIRPNSNQYDDEYKPTPIYYDLLCEHDMSEDEEEMIRTYVVPNSACGQLKKVNEYFYNPYEDGNNL